MLTCVLLSTKESAKVAKKLIEELTDDIDGTKAERTVTFAFDGHGYEIELSKKNITVFTKQMSPWVDAARKAGTVKSTTQTKATRRNARSASAARADKDAIRTWANENGHQVADRGRIARAIVEAYDAAH